MSVTVSVWDSDTVEIGSGSYMYQAASIVPKLCRDGNVPTRPDLQ